MPQEQALKNGEIPSIKIYENKNLLNVFITKNRINIHGNFSN